MTLGINDIQPNDTHNRGLICDTQHNKTVIMLSAIYGECHKALYAKCSYAEFHYTECHYAECNYTECHYAESFAESRCALSIALVGI